MDAIPSTGSFVTQDLTCFESCDGAITSTIVGGTLPYVITWTSTDPSLLILGLQIFLVFVQETIQLQ